jgi:DNA polymerase-3 subunit alpha
MDKNIDKLTIVADATALDEGTVNDLSTIIKDNPGTTNLFFQLHDTETNSYVMLRSQTLKVNVNNTLISYIEDNPDMNYLVN